MQAQVAIYDYRGSASTIGAFASSPSSGAGFLVIDLGTYQATYIGLLTLGSKGNRQLYFQETPLANFLITEVAGPRSQTYTVLAKAEAPGTQYAGVALHQAKAVGVNSSVLIRSFPSALFWTLPKSLGSSSLAVTRDASHDFLTQESGTYALNAKVTTSWNNAGLGLRDFVSFVRDIHAGNGVPELVLPLAN